MEQLVVVKRLLWNAILAICTYRVKTTWKCPTTGNGSAPRLASEVRCSTVALGTVPVAATVRVDPPGSQSLQVST
jgi:hypothetical protein